MTKNTLNFEIISPGNTYILIIHTQYKLYKLRLSRTERSTQHSLAEDYFNGGKSNPVLLIKIWPFINQLG